ncbi:hypothetical protein GCM10009809_29640 [Isoptericola hypogeus]|uniref:Sulfotransferase family protein n=1 Tax=Isoptericola hypogeus TaxID=300179 RepID=A0ABN2JPJ0_9MICO
MRALVHIGTEKTGTTSIQEFLSSHRDQLDSVGMHFLRSAGERNNRWLPAACVDLDRPDDFFSTRGIEGAGAREQAVAGFVQRFHQELRSLPERTESVVISSEHLHSRLVSQAEVDRLAGLLGEHVDEVRVICYLRPQVDLCSSLYSTALRVGHTIDFETFLEQCHPGNPYYDYASLLDRWSSTFGRDSLTVRRYPQDLRNGDLLDDFSQWLSIDNQAGRGRDVSASNTSISTEGQWLALAINRAFPGSRSRDSEIVRARAVDLVARRLAGSGRQPDPASRQRIQSAFDESNDAVRARFFPDDGELFPGKPSRSTPPTDGDVGRDAAVVATTAEVLRLVADSAVERRRLVHRVRRAAAGGARRMVGVVPSRLFVRRGFTDDQQQAERDDEYREAARERAEEDVPQ